MRTGLLPKTQPRGVGKGNIQQWMTRRAPFQAATVEIIPDQRVMPEHVMGWRQRIPPNRRGHALMGDKAGFNANLSERRRKIGRASWRERRGQDVGIAGGGVYINKKNNKKKNT